MAVYDKNIFCRLLLNNSSSSTHTKLARMILSRLNWNIIPYEIHCDVACLVVTAALKDSTLEHWGWQTIVRLKLHISDKAFEGMGGVHDVETFDSVNAGFYFFQFLFIDLFVFIFSCRYSRSKLFSNFRVDSYDVIRPYGAFDMQ